MKVGCRFASYPVGSVARERYVAEIVYARRMSPDEQAEAQETLALLRQMVKNLDVSELTDEGRELILSEWPLAEHEKPESVDLVGGLMAMTGLTVPGDMEPRLFLCLQAAKTVGLAIQEGLPGAELLADELLRRCGFDDAQIEKLLGEMVAQAPAPEAQSLN